MADAAEDVFEPRAIEIELGEGKAPAKRWESGVEHVKRGDGTITHLPYRREISADQLKAMIDSSAFHLADQLGQRDATIAQARGEKAAVEAAMAALRQECDVKIAKANDALGRQADEHATRLRAAEDAAAARLAEAAATITTQAEQSSAQLRALADDANGKLRRQQDVIAAQAELIAVLRALDEQRTKVLAPAAAKYEQAMATVAAAEAKAQKPAE